MRGGVAASLIMLAASDLVRTTFEIGPDVIAKSVAIETQ